VQSISRRLMIGAALTVLVTLGSVMNRNSTTGALHAADGGPTVTIGGPLPLPTTAVQNGAWNVGLTGTPTVNVGNHVAVRNIDEKGRNPYMQGGFVNCPPANGLCDTLFPPVPAGKRLVVEHVSANIGLNPGSGINGAFLLAGGNAVFSLPGRSMATPQIVGVNEQVLAYYEAGQTPVFRLAWAGGGNGGEASSVLSGYLVDLSQ
jgi:hypothetical protein